MRFDSAPYTRVLSSPDTEESLQQDPSYTRSNLESLIFDICSGCHKLKMSAVPQGAYAARKVHINMSKSATCDQNILANKKNDSDRNIPPHYHFPQANKKFLDHPPAKYNSKLMNSIWGLYNRYSVHNLKKITEGDKSTFLGEQQLTAAASHSSLSGCSKGGPINDPQPLVIAVWEALCSGHTY